MEAEAFLRAHSSERSFYSSLSALSHRTTEGSRLQAATSVKRLKVLEMEMLGAWQKGHYMARNGYAVVTRRCPLWDKANIADL